MNLLNRIKALFRRAPTPYAAFVNTKANRRWWLVDFRPFQVGDRVRALNPVYSFGARTGVITKVYSEVGFSVELDGIPNPVPYPGWAFFAHELTRLP